MGRSDLTFDTGNCQEIANYIAQQGVNIQSMMDEYRNHILHIKEYSIRSGETADAFAGYLECLSKMDNEIETVARYAKECIEKFIVDVDSSDHY